jgi:hypothetical protein
MGPHTVRFCDSRAATKYLREYRQSSPAKTTLCARFLVPGYVKQTSFTDGVVGIDERYRYMIHLALLAAAPNLWEWGIFFLLCLIIGSSELVKMFVSTPMVKAVTAQIHAGMFNVSWAAGKLPFTQGALHTVRLGDFVFDFHS